MKDMNEINMKELREAIKALNEMDEVTEKVRYVGVKKETMVDRFTQVVHQLDAKNVDIPVISIVFYNEIYADEVEEELLEVEDEVEDTLEEELLEFTEDEKEPVKTPKKEKVAKKEKKPKVQKKIMPQKDQEIYQNVARLLKKKEKLKEIRRMMEDRFQDRTPGGVKTIVTKMSGVHRAIFDDTCSSQYARIYRAWKKGETDFSDITKTKAMIYAVTKFAPLLED